MFAMANNGPEVLRMFWYWAWFRIRKASSRYFTGPLGPESEGAPHLRVYTCLCTFLVGSLLALSAAGQSAVPAAQSEATVTSPGAQGQDTSSTPPAQQPTTPSPASAALPTPSITGPLQGLPPAIFDAGPFGEVAVNGVLSGMGLWQSNHILGDNSTQAALSNWQVFLQRTDGWFQFYLQAGAYNIPALGTPFLDTGKVVSDLYGPLPVAFLKLVPGKNTSILIGALPTLMGAEYTFTFENMNIERGLLWNQENAINRGIQVNQTMGKFTASLSWNDGYYSNRYSWVSGSLTYTNGPHGLAFVGMGNLGQTA